MFKNNTVFILGAGSSDSYGYPTGNELYNNIVNDTNLSPIVDSLFYLISERVKIRGGYFFNIDETKGAIRNKIIEFQKCLERAATPSIDVFIELRYNESDKVEEKQQALEIGKLFIAKELISKEEHKSIYSTNNKDDWYKYLWQNHIFDPQWQTHILRKEYEYIYKNINISFITFNYDRSLEYYLSNAIQEAFGIKEYQIMHEIMKRFEILHLYGSLGSLPILGTGGIEYSNKKAIRRYISCADTIHIISEEREKDFNKAKEIISKAKNIVFLGFGYDDTNLDRLDVKSFVNKIIYGSVFGYNEEETNLICNKFNSRTGVHIETHCMKCLPFLRKTLPALK